MVIVGGGGDVALALVVVVVILVDVDVCACMMFVHVLWVSVCVCHLGAQLSMHLTRVLRQTQNGKFLLLRTGPPISPQQ